LELRRFCAKISRNRPTIGFPMPKIARKAIQTTRKSSRKKATESTPKSLQWENLLWHSTARNWRAEFRKRMETGQMNPWINPETQCYYTVAAQNYREQFLFFQQAPKQKDNATNA